MNGEIVAFDSGMLPEASRLLADRHTRDRRILPELPARFEQPSIAQAAIETLLKRQHTSGVAATHQGHLLGFMIGTLNLDPVWGRSVWIRQGGFAVVSGQSVELLQDMYAVLGTKWVGQGCFNHFALMPITDPALLQTWYALSFGIEQVHGLLSLAVYNPDEPSRPDDLEIRRAGSADREILADLSDVIWKHQVQAPVWGIHLPENMDAGRIDWADLADDETFITWLAFYQGEPVGVQIYYRPEAKPDDLLIPENCIRLTAGGTVEASRGKGIGRALTWHGLNDARAQGYAVCDADWRSTNLLAARFWPRQGFRSVAYRLVRRVDPRIAWAHGNTRF